MLFFHLRVESASNPFISDIQTTVLSNFQIFIWTSHSQPSQFSLILSYCNGPADPVTQPITPGQTQREKIIRPLPGEHQDTRGATVPVTACKPMVTSS